MNSSLDWTTCATTYQQHGGCRGRSVGKASPCMSEDLSLDPQKPCAEQDVVGAPIRPSNDDMEGGDKSHRVHRPTGLA